METLIELAAIELVKQLVRHTLQNPDKTRYPAMARLSLRVIEFL